MIFSVFQKNWVFGYSWSTLLWYRCYYPHRSRDALSPVCGIFLFSFFLNFISVVVFFLNMSHVFNENIFDCRQTSKSEGGTTTKPKCLWKLRLPNQNKPPIIQNHDVPIEVEFSFWWLYRAISC